MIPGLTRFLVRPYVPVKEPSKTVAVVVPLHDKIGLSEDEEISLTHLRRHLSGYDKYLVAPPKVPANLEGFKVLRFPRKYFGSNMAHSRLLYQIRFFKPFEDYEYILMYHLDALVFRDELMEWCRRGYDYIGAPWLVTEDTPWVKEAGVGNGGFALYRVATFLNLYHERYRQKPVRFWEDRFAFPLNLIRRMVEFATGSKNDAGRTKARGLAKRLLQRLDEVQINTLHNDLFIAHHAGSYIRDFRIPEWKVALEFAFEAAPRLCFDLNQGELPFGCHAWRRYDGEFWEPHLLKDEESPSTG